MTHEQKPESPEFRTREGLLPCPFCGAPAERMDFDYKENVVGSFIVCTICETSGPVEFGSKENLVSRWNTRASNAAQQRRKDAEGAEPVGYVRPNLMERFRQSKALFAREGIVPKRDKIHTEALYATPANVTALEARVKELEAQLGAMQLGAMQHGAVRQVIHSPLRHFKPEDRS